MSTRLSKDLTKIFSKWNNFCLIRSKWNYFLKYFKPKPTSQISEQKTLQWQKLRMQTDPSQDFSVEVKGLKSDLIMLILTRIIGCYVENGCDMLRTHLLWKIGKIKRWMFLGKATSIRRVSPLNAIIKEKKSFRIDELYIRKWQYDTPLVWTMVDWSITEWGIPRCVPLPLIVKW